MPLIIMTGLPLSSKTKRSSQLFQIFSPFQETIIINEESLGIDKRNLDEKKQRMMILSKVEQALGKDVLVIVDSLNYIKGFRYQLYVIARGLGTRSAVFYCASTVEKSLEINQITKTYNDEDIRQLAMRYEEPDGRNRWDKPLFICLMDDDLQKDSKIAVELADYLKGTPPNPNASTVIKPIFESDLLSRTDKVLTSIINSIIQAQSQNRLGKIKVEGSSEEVILEEYVDLSELRRLRRQYEKINKSHTITDMKVLGDAFVKYLNLNI